MAQAPEVATYTNDPANKTLDLVRLNVGDTDCRSAYLTDAEIAFFLSEEANVTRASARAAEAIAAKCAKRVDFSHGSVRKSLSQLSKNYLDLAKRLHRDATIGSVTPQVLGITTAGKATADEDTGAVQPTFKKGMHDNPRSGAVAPWSDPNNPTA